MAPPPRNAGGKKKANRKPIVKEGSKEDKAQKKEKSEAESLVNAKAKAQEYKDNGNVAFKAGNWALAIEEFTNAIREDCTDHVFFSNRSAANLKLLRTADAVADARGCTAIAPQWVKGWTRLGAALWADRQHKDALGAYDQAIRLEPTEELKVAREQVAKELAEMPAESDSEDESAAPFAPKTRAKEFEPIIGIDLGTTYSAVAVWDVASMGVKMLADDNGSNTVASYVAWTEDGERVVGDRAKTLASRLPKRSLFDVKRIIGRKFHDEAVQNEKKRMPYGVVAGKEDRVEVEVENDTDGSSKRFVPEEVSAMVLGHMKAIAEKNLGREVTKAVVTVPAYFNDAQRKATMAAGAIAGLDVLRIINEPTAAALGYGLDQNTKHGATGASHVLIFDLGGGTFDVSVLHIEDGLVEVKATGGDTRLGGEDFDNAVTDWILEDLKKRGHKDLGEKVQAKIKRAAENAKRELSGKDSAEIDFEQLGGDLDGSLTLTKEKFEELCAPLFQRTFDTVINVLKDAKLDKTQIDDIVLVGGSTRVPKIQETLISYFGGKTLCKSIHPDEAVAYGAAVQGAILSGVRTSASTEMLLIDVTPLSLGIEIQGKVHSIIIPRNSPIPCQKKSMYTTVENYQESIDCNVYEGERPCVDGNRLLGDFEITGIERAKKGEAQVEVSFSLDANGVLNVAALDKKTRARAECTISDACKGLDPAEVKRMLGEAEEMKEFDKEYKKKLDLKMEIEECAYGMGDDKGDELLEWLDNLDLGSTPLTALKTKLRACGA